MIEYKCLFHEDREAIGGCHICSRNLCYECYGRQFPPVCPKCAKKSVRLKRKLRRIRRLVKRIL